MSKVIVRDANLCSLVGADAKCCSGVRVDCRRTESGPHLIRLDPSQVRALLRPIPAARPA